MHMHVHMHMHMHMHVPRASSALCTGLGGGGGEAARGLRPPRPPCGLPTPRGAPPQEAPRCVSVLALKHEGGDSREDGVDAEVLSTVPRLGPGSATLTHTRSLSRC